MVQNGDIDILLAHFYMTADRVRRITFTYPIDTGELAFVRTFHCCDVPERRKCFVEYTFPGSSNIIPRSYMRRRLRVLTIYDSSTYSVGNCSCSLSPRWPVWYAVFSLIDTCGGSWLLELTGDLEDCMQNTNSVLFEAGDEGIRSSSLFVSLCPIRRAILRRILPQEMCCC